MKSGLYVLGLVMLCFFGCKSSEKLSLQTMTPNTMLVDSSDFQEGAYFLSWDLDNSPKLWKPAADTHFFLESYRDSLKIVMGKDSFTNTLKWRSWKYKGLSIVKFGSDSGDFYNQGVIKLGRVGRIRSVNDLEAQLLNYQMSHYPMLGHPTEFHGFILVNDSLDKVRVYFAGSDQPWPPKPWPIFDAMEIDLKNGWKLRSHLHNHYEPATNGYIGILAPSMADAQFYKMLKEEFAVSNALITNGFHTVIIPAESFSLFKSR